jgi:hypothetical protein
MNKHTVSLQVRRFVRTSFVIIYATIVVLSPVQKVFADGNCDETGGADGTISQCQQQAFSDGAQLFDVSTGGVCGVTTASSLSGNNNQQIVFNYFNGKTYGDNQLEPIHAAAIVGNLMGESGGRISSTSQQDDSASATPKAGVGFGIAQWTSGGRQQNLVKFAAAAGKPVTDFATQLDFMWKEMQDSYGTVIKNLMAQSDIGEATGYFMGTSAEKVMTDDALKSFMAAHGRVGGYENPGKPYLDRRIKNAQDVLKAFGGDTESQTDAGSGTTDSSLVSADSSGNCNVATPGQDTQYVDGFTIYSQYDPAWKNKAYGTSTIGDSGCGPTSMAMIITNLTSAQVTPDVTAKYAADNGQYKSGQGSSWSIASVLAKHWGLKSTAVGSDMQKINEALQSGGLVIAGGRGALPFTSSGHYVVIRALTADGKWLLGDPAHKDSNTKEWDPQYILGIISSSGHSGSVYAISK